MTTVRHPAGRLAHARPSTGPCSGAGRWRWAVHLALLPPLVCLPYWLGYVPLTFTSSDEKGGVLYPALIAQLSGLPWSGLDTAILGALPKPLEPLSQTTGPMLSLSGFGAPGPVAVTGLGLLIGVVIVAGPAIVRRRAWISNRVLSRFR